MIVAERRFKKEIRFATSSYLSEMEFKGSKKQKKTTVCSKCTDFSSSGDLLGKVECSNYYYTFDVSMKMCVFIS